MHLILDGYGGNRELLSDVKVVHALLDECSERIGMTKISPPSVVRYVGKKPEDWGVSGFVLIAESHISIHTFPERGYVNVDIFSCKEFDWEEAVVFFQERFSLEKVETEVIQRGVEYIDYLELKGKEKIKSSI
jgi:S-adenosylmethionine decarboxylase